MTVNPAGELVSILINNYNYAGYLGEAIDSALTQTWPNVEVIVVDDGSTDDSAAVIAGFGSRITPILQPNGGQGAAFNAGWDASSGGVVIFLDADDALHSTFAERAVAELARSPDLMLAQFRMRVVDRDRTPLGTTVPPSHVALASGDIGADVRSWKTSSSLSPNGSVAFRRRTLEEVLPLPADELRQGVDFYLLRAAAILGPIAGIDEALTDYRFHGANDSNRSELSIEGLRTEMRRYVSYGQLLTRFCQQRDLAVPHDPLRTSDPLFLSRRIVSLRLDPKNHPFPTDNRWGLTSAGVRAALTRRDVSLVGRSIHATWFIVVGLAPKQVAGRLGAALILPLSRGRLGALLDAMIGAAGKLRRLLGLRR